MRGNTRRAVWTNESVRALALGFDPVDTVKTYAQALVAKALDLGWSGPPFDPLRLADLLGIALRASPDVADARLLGSSEAPTIEFNPQRPRSRLRYSIAHEIAHWMFPDWEKTVRNRLSTGEIVGDLWELESLCNVAAAEFLMPLGSMQGLLDPSSSFDELLEMQRRFEVSPEAFFIRAARLSASSSAMLVAHARDDGSYEVEYSIGSPAWPIRIDRGDEVSSSSVLGRCTGIGFTVKAVERWHGVRDPLRIEAIGVPGFPGSARARVVAWLRPVEEREGQEEWIEFMRGDATKPVASGPRLIVQVLPHSTRVWGGGGFAAAVRRRYPKVHDEYGEWFVREGRSKGLGAVHIAQAGSDVWIASILAQYGVGPSVAPRIRYQALLAGLTAVARRGAELGATFHMPRIGCGAGGGSWAVVEELLASTLRSTGRTVNVYDRPDVPLHGVRPKVEGGP